MHACMSVPRRCRAARQGQTAVSKALAALLLRRPATAALYLPRACLQRAALSCQQAVACLLYALDPSIGTIGAAVAAGKPGKSAGGLVSSNAKPGAKLAWLLEGLGTQMRAQHVR